MKFQFKSPDEVSHVGALRSIVGMQFIQHDVFQGRRYLVYITVPQRHVTLLHQTIVQHLEVGQHNIRYRIDDGIPVLNDVIRPHGGGVFFMVIAFANEQTCGHPPI
ncbi:MAG: hypothetical protein BWY72_00674 [Bacteroidetes bacterium ADurb.Bin416]|nr:MAG: hypothetical protein BWY72_00674 [Bacteroidetes bacterium ADurb.Bin416]